MASYREFGTYFIVPRCVLPHIEGVGVRNSWSLSTQPDPTKRHWCDSEGRIAHTLFNGGALSARSKRNLRLARQIVIRCAKEETALRVASLIRAGTLLGYPDLTQFPDVTSVYPLDQIGRRIPMSNPLAKQFHHYNGAECGCSAANRAWRDKSLIYALEKFRLSLEHDSFTPHSGNPRYRQVFPNRYKEESYHVKAAFAIIAAFAAIEEIELEVRSSEKKPRFFDAKLSTFRWNPVVLEDIEARFRSAKINPHDTTFWLRRGSPTQVEREMKPKLEKPAKWNPKYSSVRDLEMTMPEAVHTASWLRNYVASHKFKAITSAISPYEVHSVQMITRRVLMGRLGLWKPTPVQNAESTTAKTLAAL